MEQVVKVPVSTDAEGELISAAAIGRADEKVILTLLREAQSRPLCPLALYYSHPRNMDTAVHIILF